MIRTFLPIAAAMLAGLSPALAQDVTAAPPPEPYQQVSELVDKALSPDFSEMFPFGGARCARTADHVIERLRAARR